MKIAAVSDDGITISQHFGRAAYYVVVTVQNNQIVAREKRDKLGHAQFGGETHAEGSRSARAWLRPRRAIAARANGRRDCRLRGPPSARDGRGGV